MRTAALLSIVVVAGCASSATTPAASVEEQTVRVSGSTSTTQIHTTATTRPQSTNLDMSLEAVWRVLPAAYASVGIDVAHTDRAARVIGNPGFRARRRLADTPISRFLDCGNAQGGPSADSYEIHFSVLTDLQAESPERTIVTTLVEAVARPINFSGEPVRCLSKGELETRIARAAAGQ
jgi:hypothetical protein